MHGTCHAAAAALCAQLPRLNESTSALALVRALMQLRSAVGGGGVSGGVGRGVGEGVGGRVGGGVGESGVVGGVVGGVRLGLGLPSPTPSSPMILLPSLLHALGLVFPEGGGLSAPSSRVCSPFPPAPRLRGRRRPSCGTRFGGDTPHLSAPSRTPHSRWSPGGGRKGVAVDKWGGGGAGSAWYPTAHAVVRDRHTRSGWRARLSRRHARRRWLTPSMTGGRRRSAGSAGGKMPLRRASRCRCSAVAATHARRQSLLTAQP